MALAPLEIQRHAAPLRQQVLERLRAAIIGGQLAPGQRLIERELTEMTGVSRTVVREVLRQLESEGLVAIIPHKGPVVRELSAGEARDLYTIRGALEGIAARLFHQRRGRIAAFAPEETRRISRDLAAKGAAQQLIHRFVECLAHQIP